MSKYYSKVEMAGKVSWIAYGTSKNGNTYVNGYLQSYEIGEYQNKEIKKNFASIKLTAFGENADMINALGTQKNSDLKIDGYLKYNSYKNASGEDVSETIVIVTTVYESLNTTSNANVNDGNFFSTPSSPRKSSNVDTYDGDLDDDLPF